MPRLLEETPRSKRACTGAGVPRAAPRALPRRAGRRGTLPPAALAALGRPPTAHPDPPPYSARTFLLSRRLQRPNLCALATVTAPEPLCPRDVCQRTCIPPLTSALHPPPGGAQVALGWVPCRAMFAFVFRRISAPPSGDSSGGLEAFLYMCPPPPPPPPPFPPPKPPPARGQGGGGGGGGSSTCGTPPLP